ncbi:MAG: hypothetical protein K1X94_19015 [Sandaracinaceae bacterium]|nr:hypothetical protein [Sandaracinaceae bacterium]
MDRQHLLAAFEVTDAELDVNRRGELTERQRQRVRRAVDDDATFMAGLALVLGVVMYGIGGYLAYDGRVFAVHDAGDVLGIAGIVFGTVLLPTSAIAWAGYTAWIASRARGPLSVKTLEGEVETRHIAYKESEIFELHVAGERYDISKAAHAVIASGARHRVFVIPEIRMVIAVEPVGVRGASGYGA